MWIYFINSLNFQMHNTILHSNFTILQWLWDIDVFHWKINERWIASQCASQHSLSHFEATTCNRCSLLYAAPAPQGGAMAEGNSDVSRGLANESERMLANQSSHLSCWIHWNNNLAGLNGPALFPYQTIQITDPHEYLIIQHINEQHFTMKDGGIAVFPWDFS